MESANHSRTRMFWKADLKKEFDEVLKDYRLNPGKENGYPSIKFTKGGNCFNSLILSNFNFVYNLMNITII